MICLLRLEGKRWVLLSKHPTMKAARRACDREKGIDFWYGPEAEAERLLSE